MAFSLALRKKPPKLTQEQYLEKLLRKGLHPDGSPILDPTPIAPPIGYKKAPSMVEIVRDMVRGERLKQAAIDAGHETFEEAEDFDIEEDPIQRSSPWVNEFDPPLSELVQAGHEETTKKKQPKADKKGEGGGSPDNPPPDPDTARPQI